MGMSSSGKTGLGTSTSNVYQVSVSNPIPAQPPTRLSHSSAFVASFLAYGFGQALTDWFRRDTDRLSAPYRPLSGSIQTKIQDYLTRCVRFATSPGTIRLR